MSMPPKAKTIPLFGLSSAHAIPSHALTPSCPRHFMILPSQNRSIPKSKAAYAHGTPCQCHDISSRDRAIQLLTVHYSHVIPSYHSVLMACHPTQLHPMPHHTTACAAGSTTYSSKSQNNGCDSHLASKTAWPLSNTGIKKKLQKMQQNNRHSSRSIKTTNHALWHRSNLVAVSTYT